MGNIIQTTETGNGTAEQCVNTSIQQRSGVRKRRKWERGARPHRSSPECVYHDALTAVVGLPSYIHGRRYASTRAIRQAPAFFSGLHRSPGVARRTRFEMRRWKPFWFVSSHPSSQVCCASSSAPFANARAYRAKIATSTASGQRSATLW